MSYDFIGVPLQTSELFQDVSLYDSILGWPDINPHTQFTIKIHDNTETKRKRQKLASML
jgi:hypothetical protein